MRFEVVLTEDAERDLEDIVTHIATHDSPQKAEHVLGRILEIQWGPPLPPHPLAD